MSCESSFEANIIKGRLKSEGIESFITNENFSGLMPNYNQILNSSIQIMINEIDYDKAREILELNKKQEHICPNCQSTNIKFSFGKNKIKKLILITLSLLLVIPFNNLKSIYKCQDCRTEF